MLGRVERFEGFADNDAKFFKALAKHQDRDWYASHKQEFEEGWQRPMLLLLSEVRSAVDAAYAHCDLEEPKVFRIFRDVRFSKDKSPYKTHIGGHVSVKSRGKSYESATAFYFHVGHDEAFAAAGYYMMDAPALARYRDAVADASKGAELVKIMTSLTKKGFVPDAHETLKRVPKGFDPEHPRADHLKRKGLVVTMPPLPKGVLSSRKLVTWALPYAKAVVPLVEWLVYATA